MFLGTVTVNVLVLALSYLLTMNNESALNFWHYLVILFS